MCSANRIFSDTHTYTVWVVLAQFFFHLFTISDCCCFQEEKRDWKFPFHGFMVKFIYNRCYCERIHSLHFDCRKKDVHFMEKCLQCCNRDSINDSLLLFSFHSWLLQFCLWFSKLTRLLGFSVGKVQRFMAIHIICYNIRAWNFYYSFFPQ